MEAYTTAYDLKDAGLAVVHLEGEHEGPAGIVAIVPESRRPLLRDEFPLELMTLISFLGGPVNHGCDFAIHDYIEEALRKEPSATHIFALETAALGDDAGIVLSAHFENLSAAMLQWMTARESREDILLEDRGVLESVA
jgi:hypothetical protein